MFPIICQDYYKSGFSGRINYMSNVQKTQSKESITLSKKEYLRLKKQAYAYRSIATKAFEWPLKGSVGEVVEDFKATGKYSTKFLADLEDGLKKSSYSK